MATLRALQSDANNKGVESKLTWQALANATAQMGAPAIDYDRFAARWDAEPELKQIVDRFDGNGLVINTNDQAGQLPQGQDTGQVEKMAKRATKLGK